MHFHVCVVNRVFEALAGGCGGAGADTDTLAVVDGQSSTSKAIYHPASAIDETAMAQVQATLRRRILRALVGRGLLKSFEAKDMLAYNRCTKPRSEPRGDQRADKRADQRGAGADELNLTPLELIGRIAALVPPPRTHRHRYFGVLAPNSPLRAAVTAMALPAQAQPQPARTQAEPAATGEGRSGKCSTTSASILSRHGYRQRAGHRCGMLVSRWVAVAAPSQTGIWLSSRLQTMRSISASVGDGPEQ